MEEKYVVYVGTYTHENSIGIHLYDLDAKSGEMKEHFTFCRTETLSQ